MKRVNRNQRPEGLIKWEGDGLSWIDQLTTMGYAVEIVGFDPEESCVYYRKTGEFTDDNHGDNEYANEDMKNWDMMNPSDGVEAEQVAEQYWDDPEDLTLKLVNDVVNRAYRESGLDSATVEDHVSAMLLWFEGAISGKARVSPIEKGEDV